MKAPMKATGTTIAQWRIRLGSMGIWPGLRRWHDRYLQLVGAAPRPNRTQSAVSPMNHDLAAVLRGERNATGVPLLARGCGGVDGAVAQHGSQHHIHLHVGEHSSYAASGATAERDPREGGRFGANEALRIEAIRLGKCTGIGMHLLDADD